MNDRQRVVVRLLAFWVACSLFGAGIGWLSGLAHNAVLADPIAGTTLPSATALFETSLASRISSTDTSMTLAANSVGGTSISGYNCFTIDEGRSDAEFVCGTVSGTSVTSLARGISFTNGTTTSTSLAYAHRVGANVKITDHPLLARLMAQNSGTDTFPNLLNYTYSPNYTSASSTAVASKGYVDSVSFAGTTNGDESTKGIYELATGLEAASSTLTGSTGARLVLSTKSATDTPQNCTLANPCIPVTTTTGKLAQGFLDLTKAFTWAGTHIFNGAVTLASTVTVNGAATFNVAPTVGTISATSTTATSTFSGGLTVSKTASTTNMVISNQCTGCLSGYETITNTDVGPTTIGTTVSVSASCTGSKKVIGGGGSETIACSTLNASRPSGGNSWSVTYSNSSGGTCAANTMTVYAICVNP